MKIRFISAVLCFVTVMIVTLSLNSYLVWAKSAVITAVYAEGSVRFDSPSRRYVENMILKSGSVVRTGSAGLAILLYAPSLTNCSFEGPLYVDFEGVGVILGPVPLGGFLLGAIATGFILAVMMANAGGSWDNAKKWIETGKFGGKGSDAHKAGVIGDTVGDPMKDTSGPSLNILIKLMSIIALVLAPALAGFEGLIKF